LQDFNLPYLGAKLLRHGTWGESYHGWNYPLGRAKSTDGPIPAIPPAAATLLATDPHRPFTRPWRPS